MAGLQRTLAWAGWNVCVRQRRRCSDQCLDGRQLCRGCRFHARSDLNLNTNTNTNTNTFT
jgi:hypothetical protein